MRRWWVLAAAAVVLVTALAALAPPSPSQAVRSWLSGYLDVAYAGDPRHAAYLTLDASLDDRALGYDHVSGRFAAISALRRESSTHGPVATGSLYLDTDGAAAVQTVTPVDRGVCETETPLVRAVDVGAAGITAETLLPATLISGTACTAAATGVLRADPGAALAHQVAARWARAWSPGGRAARADLYAQQAVVVDTVHGLDLRNGAAVRDAPALGAVTLDSLAGHHPLPRMQAVLGRPVAAAPAVYVGRVTPLSSRVEQVWLAVHVDGVPQLVALTLDASGRVVAERRLTDAAVAARTARPGGCCEAAWWVRRQPPVPLEDRRETLTLGGAPVDVVNATPALLDDLRWAVGRYALAGLPPPTLSTVVFDPYDPLCVRDDGRTTVGPDGTSVLVCAEEHADCRAMGCDPMAERRMLVLHELGHAWEAEHVTSGTRRAFEHLVGTSRWADPDGDPRRLGVEWAADTLAWGLDGDPDAPLRVGTAPCETLREGFTLLSGTSPFTTCADPPSGHDAPS